MKNRTYFFMLHAMVCLVFIVTLVGCSTAQVRVFSYEDGTHEVVSRDIERDDAEEEAYDNAKDYCKKQGKEMIVLAKEQTDYTGKINESDRTVIRKASKAAMIVGVPMAGAIGMSSTNDRDYKTSFKFKCK